MNNPIDRLIDERLERVRDIIRDIKYKLSIFNLNSFKQLVPNLYYRLRYGKVRGDIVYIKFDIQDFEDGKWHTMTASMDNVKITPIQNWREDYNIFEAQGKVEV